MRLRRIAIGPVQLDKLPKGKSRKLSLAELEALRHSAAKAGTETPRKEEAPAASDEVPLRRPNRREMPAGSPDEGRRHAPRPQEAPPPRTRRMTLAVIRLTVRRQ